MVCYNEVNQKGGTTEWIMNLCVEIFILLQIPNGTLHEQAGNRPVVIIQNNVGNKFSPTTIVAPLTSKQKKNSLPTHFLIRANSENGLRTDSVALLEQIRTISKDALTGKIGRIDPSIIEPALKVSLGLN